MMVIGMATLEELVVAVVLLLLLWNWKPSLLQMVEEERRGV